MNKTSVVNINFTKDYDIYIGRGSIWGNPFIIGKHGTREEVVNLYKQYLLGNQQLLLRLPELKGKVLGCHCKPNLCHGDVLVELLEEEKIMQYNKLVIGIDQSYTRTGISIAADNKLLIVRSIDFQGCKTKTEKRKHLKEILNKILSSNFNKANEIIILVERIRTISQGRNQNQGFGLRPDYLKSTGALIGMIVDTAFEYNVPVYSVDTRTWKSAILGSSKTDINKFGDFEKPEKMAAIRYVESLGFNLIPQTKDGEPLKHKRGKYAGHFMYDDDAADSACIALYGFVANPKLKLED